LLCFLKLEYKGICYYRLKPEGKAKVIETRGKRTIAEEAKTVAGKVIDCFCRSGDRSGDFDVSRRERAIPGRTFGLLKSHRLMRYFYTIFFFADTLILLCLSYLFFRKCDGGGSSSILVLIFAGIAASILLLALLLRNYLRLPQHKRGHR
jgi:hypothetical protein